MGNVVFFGHFVLCQTPMAGRREKDGVVAKSSVSHGRVTDAAFQGAFRLEPLLSIQKNSSTTKSGCSIIFILKEIE